MPSAGNAKANKTWFLPFGSSSLGEGTDGTRTLILAHAVQKGQLPVCESGRASRRRVLDEAEGFLATHWRECLGQLLGRGQCRLF